MDLYSRKRAVGLNSVARKGSGPAKRDIAGSRDEDIKFCNRIGCSGRLNHALHTQNYLRPSSHSSYTNVKKQELNTSESSQVKLKSKSRDSESNKGVSNLKPAGRTVEMGSSSTKIRKVYGQTSSPANQNGQMGSFDRGRKNTVKKRSKEGGTSSSARGKISGTSSDVESGSPSSYGSSVSDSRDSTNWNACRGSGISSVRTRRSVNQHGNNPSPIQPTRMTPDNVDAIANVILLSYVEWVLFI